MTEDNTDLENCYACGDPIESGDWVVPLETFKAIYWGDELALDEDHTVETVIHAECLKQPTENKESEDP